MGERCKEDGEDEACGVCGNDAYQASKNLKDR